MFVQAIFLFFIISSCDEEQLPFDDNPESIEKEPKPTTIPKKPIIISLIKLLGIREIIVGLIILLYILVYIVGGNILQKKVEELSKQFRTLMRNYFMIVPETFFKVTNHMYHTYITGRTYYTGGIVRIQFQKCRDILGILYDKILGKKDVITFELLCEPLMKNTAIFSYRNSIMREYKEYNLNEEKIEGLNKTIFTDFGPSKIPFIELIKDYEQKHPNSIVAIDMNDMNRFETREEGRFIARFQFQVNDVKDVNNEMIEFVMKMADDFNMLQLDTETYDRNLQVREAMVIKSDKEKLKP